MTTAETEKEKTQTGATEESEPTTTSDETANDETSPATEAFNKTKTRDYNVLVPTGEEEVFRRVGTYNAMSSKDAVGLARKEYAEGNAASEEDVTSDAVAPDTEEYVAVAVSGWNVHTARVTTVVQTVIE